MECSEIMDKVIVCPYDKNHRITTSRIQRHLVRCEKNFPAGYLSICPYNATHRMPKEELEKHARECHSKLLLDPSVYQHKRTNVKNPDLNPIDTFSNFDDEEDENWDIKSEAKVEFEHHHPIRFQHENHKKLEAQSLDTRVPNWVNQTVAYKMQEEDNMSTITDISETSGVSSNLGYGSIGTMLKKKHFKKHL